MYLGIYKKLKQILYETNNGVKVEYCDEILSAF